ncbi:MAG: proline dehydrogenase family protein [Myxococcota bacterium]
MTTAPEHADVDRLRARLEELRGRGLDAVDVPGEALVLAEGIQQLALQDASADERHQQERMARLMEDREGKAFTAAVTDQIFRARNPDRVADQLAHLVHHYGAPRYMSLFERAELGAFRVVGPITPKLSVPLVRSRIRKEMSRVILPAEDDELDEELSQRVRRDIRINLNHLGEAILGEDEARARVERYLEDAARPDVSCVSVKISSIASQIDPLAWDASLEVLSDRLRQLYRAAMAHPHRRPDGTEEPKLIYMDMEEYRDLELTLALFQRVLDEPEFLDCSAGLVLQAYVPDAFPAQRRLTEWAQRRVERGGHPIRLRLVKGANLANEQVEASLHDWPQAPYRTKEEVDANFKRMILWGSEPERAKAVRLGIASHNVFDVAYGLVVRALLGTEDLVGFEMLEGMANPVRRVVQDIAGDMLTYMPAVEDYEMQSAISYLIRRLDENTGPENYLRHGFAIRPGSEEWRDQAERFLGACRRMDDVFEGPRRTQDRRVPPTRRDPDAPFRNEPDTDWSLPWNREWIHGIMARWMERAPALVPVQIGGELFEDTAHGVVEAHDPSRPDHLAYRYVLASWDLVDDALEVAQEAAPGWAARPVAERSRILAGFAHRLREHRGELIGAMALDGGKAIRQSDPEISEAIDFAEYYRRSLEPFQAMGDISVEPRGVTVVTPPWNFPLAIPMGGVLGALVSGSAVILKPAPESVLVAWEAVQLLWEAGVPREALQFISCPDDTVGSRLISDERVDQVVLTGGTETARLFHRLRPDLRLMAETGGKNSIVVTAVADADLAIRDAVHSAFLHAGQKCSACSLLICEAEVYDDEGFMRRLADAARSLPVGPAWDPHSKVTPLVRPPGDGLRWALTTLEEGQRWLVEPRQDPDNPNLWSPGIRVGVEEGSRCHQEEFFGPMLALMRADDLNHALRLANGTPYGLTAGLQSLDDRERDHWLERMDAGNLYVNRGIVGAIVQRQPFGGRKASNFGPGAKAGGPNYVLQMARVKQIESPREQGDPDAPVQRLLDRLTKGDDSWRDDAEASARSYAHWWRAHFAVEHDPTKLVGQDNLFRYQPCKGVILRVDRGAARADVARVLLAARTADVPVEVSVDKTRHETHAWLDEAVSVPVHAETQEQLAARLEAIEAERLRVLGPVSGHLREVANAVGVHVETAPPLANGRVELIRYVREQALCIDYHRYGNLGEREDEERAAIR